MKNNNSNLPPIKRQGSGASRCRPEAAVRAYFLIT